MNIRTFISLSFHKLLIKIALPELRYKVQLRNIMLQVILDHVMIVVLHPCSKSVLTGLVGLAFTHTVSPMYGFQS